ncbi:tRNA pseudouridine synthase A-like [Dioscorea cayenensis subsp. rotundata]|uniref:tRNA pseudouridine synthase A-like n=1 Tax=Dioscorea cayennensis subsp. rotundata TaxID=55577 RepID=A0AB40CC33_DIOCR|nr:tRNA pseudouridine synthase A-like [Dioscorea cayenensis subsp. rotundata]
MATMASPPHPKKPKMSSDDDDDAGEPTSPTAADAIASEPPRRRYKRRKIAIFLAYCGAGYQGMQKNPGARTIEGDLEEALFLSGAVPDNDRAQPRRYDWARAARTDKGVSAAGQVVSGRFYIDPPGFIDRLNSHLDPQIRIFGFKRATASFNAKKFCDRRRYVYLLPVFALDPNAHPDRESVMASLGTGNELLRCLECSERGRKVAGLMGRQSKLSDQNASLDFGNGEGVDVVEESAPQVKTIDGKEEEMEMAARTSEFSYGEKEKERFNAILKQYVGTHNFHNFTTRTKAEDPSAQRFIISFEADHVVNIEGVDFVRCEVVGQSFMLHQIRKMIGLAVAIMRNCAPESLMEVALRKVVRINVPTAPEVGLYLDECLFTSYNQKWKDSHEDMSMEAYAEQAEEFKIKHIFPHIASMELKEGAVALWLHSLNHRNYPDFRFLESNGETAGLEHVKVDEAAN